MATATPKTVRFTEVVKKCGKPEVYLLLTKDDRDFHSALKDNRIMSLVGGVDGAKTEYGLVGYDEKRRGQLLLFPRSLKPFAAMRIVGIKFDLFEETHGQEKVTTSTKSSVKKAEPSRPVKELKKARSVPTKPESKKSKKVIPFPREEREETEEKRTEELVTLARRALHALEKNNSVAAFKLLKDMVD